MTHLVDLKIGSVFQHLGSCWARAGLSAKDALANLTLARDLKSMVQWLLGGNRLQRVRAYQTAESPWLLQRLARRLHRAPVGLETPKFNDAVGQRYQAKLLSQTQLTRSLLLKAPQAAGEKGVLLIQFEYNWYRLLSQIPDWTALCKKFDVIWGTSWSPTDYALLDHLLASTSGPIVVLPSNESDRFKLSNFDSRLRCPPVLSACDWLDPAAFNPKPYKERQTDILMVANWAPFKRHFELFKALQQLPRSTRVTLIGQPEATYTRDGIRRMAKDWGVRQELEILESLSVAEVHHRQCDAKTSLILSRREGSCVAATESLLAGSPLGMRADAHVGALAYINAQTGVKFAPGRLHLQLPAFLERAGEFRPREWAVQNISCHLSLTRLEQFMQNLAQEQGRPWTQGLAPFRWQPYPDYLNSADHSALASARRQLASEFPAIFSKDLAIDSTP